MTNPLRKEISPIKEKIMLQMCVLSSDMQECIFFFPHPFLRAEEVDYKNVSSFRVPSSGLRRWITRMYLLLSASRPQG